jgi:hypothetical protein
MQTERATTTTQGLARPSLEPLFRFLEGLSDEHFYGRVTVSFQNGRVTDVREERNHKLDEL